MDDSILTEMPSSNEVKIHLGTSKF